MGDRSTLPVCLGLLLLTACRTGPQQGGLDASVATARDVVTEAIVSDSHGDSSPPPDPVDLSDMGRAANALGLDLYARLRRTPGNVVIAPAAVAAGLAVLASGARAETASELARALHLEGVPTERLSAIATASRRRWEHETGRRAEAAIGNRVFYGPRDEVPPDLVERCSRDHGAAPLGLHFQLGDFVRAQIDGWAADATSMRVDHLAPAGWFTADTRPVLVSVAYFVGTESASVTVSVQPGDFLVGTTWARVPFLATEGTLRHASVEGVRIVEFGFGGSDAVLDVIVAEPPRTLDAVENRFTTAGVFDRWLAALAPAWLAVSVPRLHIAPPHETRLADALRALGVRRAFEPSAAPFGPSALDAGSRSRRSFALQDVLTNASLEFAEATDREHGLGAAVGAGVAGLVRPFATTPALDVNHSFLFVVRDRVSGAILMLGRVVDPREPTPY